MVNGGRRALLVAAMIGIGAGLAGCRDDEQGRPMVKQKGVYEGPADEAIGERGVEDLRSRASGQKF
ncbi:MAG: hypothetical protein ACR2P3_15165 [Geminicoccaceae bacterium]